MFSFGCVYRDHSQPVEKATSSFMTALPQLPMPVPAAVTTAATEEAPVRTPVARTDASKLSPTEVAADRLEIFNIEAETQQRIEGGNSALSAKFYYQKKQFVWEYLDVSNLDPANTNKKKKIEVKFQDIKRIAIKAQEGAQGHLILETTKPLVMYREKGSQPGKNTQWMKSEDFIGGVGTPRDNGSIRLTTIFAKDALTKKQSGQTPLEKLLSSDPELQKLIDANEETRYEASRAPAETDEEPISRYLGSTPMMGFNEPTHPNYVLYEVGSGLYSQEMVSKWYADELCDRSTEELIEQMKRVLKPKVLSIPSLKKMKYKCPAFKCTKRCSTDRELHDHLAKKHKNLLELGIDVLSTGEFRVSKKFLINVLMYAKAHPNEAKQASKAANSAEPA